MTKRLTFKSVNQVIARLGYELIQGNGYLYFWAIGDYPLLPNDSYASAKLNHTTLDALVSDLHLKIEEAMVESLHFQERYEEASGIKADGKYYTLADGYRINLASLQERYFPKKSGSGLKLAPQKSGKREMVYIQVPSDFFVTCPKCGSIIECGRDDTRVTCESCGKSFNTAFDMNRLTL